MKSIINSSEKRAIQFSIGQEELSFIPETKKAVDIELLLLHVPLFGVMAAFSLNYITAPLFLILFYIIAMRIFIGNHDRYHADSRVKLPRFLERFSEGLAVVVTPWDEPYDSIRRKHLNHHNSHLPGKDSKLNTIDDPHSVFELGGILKVLRACLFYEEIQFLLDIRNRNLSKSRIYRFLIYMPLLVLFVFTFGWVKYFVLLLGMRIVGFTAWFVFSWVIHQRIVYKYGFSKDVPKWFKMIFLFLHGRRVTEGCLHHTTHHAWPRIPPSQLHTFDSASQRFPDSVPEMRPVGN